MSYYRTCPYCGAHLDPGERCDCQRESEANCQARGNLPKAEATQGGRSLFRWRPGGRCWK